MKQLFFVFIGGGIGSVLRYLISFIFKNNSYNFPWSTFIVNMIGCFLIGLIFGYLNKNEYLKDSLTSILIVGFCGGFTTFSTFASENFQLFKSEYFLTLFVYVLSSILIGIGLVLFGFWFSK